MSSSYRKTVEKLAEQNRDFNRLPCLWCKTPTVIATLNHLGARCQSCYEAYCAQGVHGGVKGFLDGRQDTAQQAEMRKRLKGTQPKPNVLTSGDAEVDAKARDAAKRETDRKVLEYARRNGLTLGDSATLLGVESRAPARAFPDEPAWFAAGDRS